MNEGRNGQEDEGQKNRNTEFFIILPKPIILPLAFCSVAINADGRIFCRTAELSVCPNSQSPRYLL
jgi:hypothetical protein